MNLIYIYFSESIFKRASSVTPPPPKTPLLLGPLLINLNCKKVYKFAKRLLYFCLACELCVLSSNPVGMLHK